MAEAKFDYFRSLYSGFFFYGAHKSDYLRNPYIGFFSCRAHTLKLPYWPTI